MLFRLNLDKSEKRYIIWKVKPELLFHLKKKKSSLIHVLVSLLYRVKKNGKCLNDDVFLKNDGDEYDIPFVKVKTLHNKFETSK